MATFVVRRLIASVFVLLAATFLMYNLVAFSGDPLEDLRTSNAPNKEQLIESRTRLLNLDVAPPLRYFIWFFGVLRLDFGISVQGRDVNAMLEQAIGSTLQLVTIATVLAIILGLIVGITTALRQYSGYDYTVTFISFLFFSLPIFWVAVLLKQYIAIGFNDFLQDDPQLPVWLIALLSAASGLLWASIIPGALKRKITTFVIAVGATVSILVIMNLVDWFTVPGLTIIGVSIAAIGAAVGFTLLITGLQNRRALRAALVTAGIGLAVYFPFQYYVSFFITEWWMLILLGLATVGVSLLVGRLMGGHDRGPIMRITAFTGVVTALAILLDRFMIVWDDYASSGRIRGRPIATIGSSTPGLEGSLWVEGVDIYTHLLLPTIALILISFATYTRYSRSSLLEVMNQDYIRTARAKGLNERTVVVRHAFRNALIPIATIVAFDVGGIVGGAVITETVFGWTGMGQLFINGLNQVDPNPVMAFFVVVGGLAILFNLIADLAYAALDPRIRVS
ncbi:MAG: ABC transporter permease [Actinobacteria bacterium]|nr:ABC transporter permease [Actinomycetota bacterium]MBU1607958.1 ABC transporter permease [Actinomycetota bacterium]MBU2316134.1 ABC transporter permease [Actinomycetota bacterium]MBU2386082.1 ABC transporter permease [Actinomycetota bacterium]